MNSIYYKKIDERYRCFIKLQGVLVEYIVDTVLIEGISTLHQVKCTFLIKDEIKLKYMDNPIHKNQIQKLTIAGKEIDLSTFDFKINNNYENTLPSMTVYFETNLVEFE